MKNYINPEASLLPSPDMDFLSQSGGFDTPEMPLGTT